MKVTLEQFLISAKPVQQRDDPSRARIAIFNVFFDIIDTNQNGVISSKEFEVYFQAMGIGKEHAKASFDGIDANHDGKISRDEFVDTGCEYFANHDPAHPCTLFWGPLAD